LFSRMIFPKKAATFWDQALDHDEIGLNQSIIMKNYERDRFLKYRAGCGRKTGVHFSPSRSGPR